MTPDEFFDTFDVFINMVREMRENQKAYFKTRHPFYKEQSIKLEKQVDAELERLGNNLFTGQNE